jgi:hypothetical protein
MFSFKESSDTTFWELDCKNIFAQRKIKFPIQDWTLWRIGEKLCYFKINCKTENTWRIRPRLGFMGKNLLLAPRRRTCDLRDYETFRSSHQWLMITKRVDSQLSLQNLNIFLRVNSRILVLSKKNCCSCLSFQELQAYPFIDSKY